MGWFLFGIKENTISSPSLQPFFLPDQPPPASQNLHSDGGGGGGGGGFDLNDKVSPSILLIIIILAIVFFVSGLLHLLVRFLLRPPSRDPEDIDNVTVLQGQLQQLFHLHDSGVDQSFIDTLPVFHYKAIIGLKTPFDCAVCLCEFEPDDKLRLLPKCSHAFHMECIDTWLLSHSTCPLCRASLLPDFSPNNSCSPIVLVLESGSDSSRELVGGDRDSVVLGRTSSVLRTSSHLGCHGGDSELGSSHFDYTNKSCEFLTKEDAIAPPAVAVDSGEKVVPVKLGKYRNVDGGGGGGESSSSNKNIDERRCFSMGSFQYVMDENSLLQVPIRTPVKKQYGKKPSLPLIPGYRPAMSEYDCESRRGFSGFDTIYSDNVSTSSKGNAISRSRKDSFSISKIWLRGKKEKQNMAEDSSSRRASSFRFPVNRNVAADVAADGGDTKSLKNGNLGGRRTKSEIVMRGNGGSGELGCDEENQSCARDSVDSLGKTPSFARRTLLWLVGRQNKVVHSSFTPNI